MFVRVVARRPVKARLRAGAIFAACATVLSIAAYVTPSASGVGTHVQLGGSPCLALMLFGFPCPTCGMTTAFAHTVRGELWSAFNAHPAGLALALGTVLTAWLSLGVVVTGKVWTVNWYRLPPIWLPAGVVLLLLAGWAYKVAIGLASGALPHGG